SGSIYYDDIHVRAHKLAREPAQALISAAGIALFDRDVLAFNVTRRPQAVSERIELLGLRCCLRKKSTRATFVGCARDARGHAAPAPPPSSVMNSRRLMGSLGSRARMPPRSIRQHPTASPTRGDQAHFRRARIARPITQSLSLSDRKLSSSVKWVTRWR